MDTPLLVSRYIAAEDGTIRYAEVRQQLLSGEWAGDAAETAASTCPPLKTTSLQPTPSLDVNVAAFALNRQGTHAIIAGPTLEDPEVSGAFLLDLAARQVQSTTDGTSGTVPAIALDPTLFANRPGLRVLQAAWHPDSDYHVALLTSDATWRLYSIRSLDLAEQTFELMAGLRRPFGLGGAHEGESSAPVAFSFGQGEGWDRFTIYFLAANGALSTLCPVAPFGARYPSSAIDALRASLDDAAPSEAAAETASAWLQRAFCPVAAFLRGDTPTNATVLEASRPHALDDHCPMLAGPISVASADNPSGAPVAHAAFKPSGRAQDLLMWRFGGSCTTVATGYSCGTVMAYVLAGGAVPQWLASPPQCVADGDVLRAVRCQSGTAESALADEDAAPQLLLVDVVKLESDGSVDVDLASAGEASRRIGLCLDRAQYDTFYALTPTSAYAIELPWLPIVADTVAEAAEGNGAGSGLADVLPRPKVESLVCDTRFGVLDGAAVGDALCDAALVVLHGDGSRECVRPRHAVALITAGDGADAAAVAVAAEQRAKADAEAHVKRAYADALKGPRPAKLPVPSGEGAATPSGQRVLVEAVAELRSAHVEFAHQAHHDLMERLDQVCSEVEAQQERAQRASALADQVDASSERLAAGLKRVAWLADNLSRRMHLLAELHWALPRPRSQAEVAFLREELPAMEEAAKRMGEEVAAASARAAALRRQCASLGGSGGGGGSSGGSWDASVPPSQLRKVREMLAEHERAIGVAKQQMEALKHAIMAA